MSPSSSSPLDLPGGIPAGDFSTWLHTTLANLKDEQGVEVDCRTCTGCCTSSYFIHIRPDETQTLAQIPRRLRVAAPGMPSGHVLLGFNQEGVCPMLKGGQCAIYSHRPQTCRNYDCRVFAAVGLEAGGDDKAHINQRIHRWEFSFPTPRDRQEKQAVQAAAQFIRDHAEQFPGGRVPTNPSQLALLALKSHPVFLPGGVGTPEDQPPPHPAEIARHIVEVCRNFDAQIARSSV